MSCHRIVFLIDNKRRDLMVAGVIGRHLEEKGHKVFYEPLEATFAVLAAYRPDVIVFNHLSASHLVAYSRRLHDLGVIVAVLPNEGVAYQKESQDFLALKGYANAWIDIYFCWNRPLSEAVKRNDAGGAIQAPVVGVPRFDLYFEPFVSHWRKTCAWLDTTRPNVLVCTNYALAKYHTLPVEEADKLFRSWADSITWMKDYRGCIAVQYRNRERLFSFLQALAISERYNVILRPHPNEEADWYVRRLAEMPDRLGSRIRLAVNENITQLIVNCDLEISMDSCTTAMESWIAGKPTIDLPMESHEILTKAAVQGLNTTCDDPSALPDMVASALINPVSEELCLKRAAHLETWCSSPDGTSSLRVATFLNDVADRRGEIDYADRLTLDDRRKALKLKILRAFGLPYNWQPQLALRGFFDPKGTFIKRRIHAKTMTPKDERAMRALVSKIYAN